MNKKTWIGMCMACSLLALTGCSNGISNQDVKKNQQSESVQSSPVPASKVGQGFQPPEGSRIDRNGNIVDKEGNTFNREGEWQVPEGGHVDSSGRIVDRNGNIMGGGARVGSVG